MKLSLLCYNPQFGYSVTAEAKPGLKRTGIYHSPQRSGKPHPLGPALVVAACHAYRHPTASGILPQPSPFASARPESFSFGQEAGLGLPYSGQYYLFHCRGKTS